MSAINVLLEIPANLAKGLADGALERVGSVIRDAKTKKVVSWLSETDSPTEETSRGTSSGGPRLGGLANQNMIMGLQVANLTVNIVGFSLVYRKLKHVENMLYGIDNKIDTLTANQEWLDKKHFISQLAPAMSAIKTIKSIRNIKNEKIHADKLINADDNLGIADEYFRQVLGRMLSEKLEHEYPEEFCACYRAWVIANQGRVHTMIALNETDESIERLTTFKSEHSKIGKQYQAARNDHIRRISSGQKSLQASPLLTELSQQMVGVHEIINGQKLQMEFIHNNDIKIPAPPKNLNDSKSNLLVFVVQD